MVEWNNVDTPDPSCALCGKSVGVGETAHAVRGKFICGDCRRVVLATEPRPVLPYADRPLPRRRWLWPAVAAAALAAAIAASLLLTAQRTAVGRAQAEQLRALAAEKQAKAAAEAARARAAETRPVE